jgi:hypothetical protein
MNIYDMDRTELRNEIAFLKDRVEYLTHELSKVTTNEIPSSNGYRIPYTSEIDGEIIKIGTRHIDEIIQRYAILRKAILVLQALVDWARFDKEELPFVVEIDGSVTWEEPKPRGINPIQQARESVGLDGGNKKLRRYIGNILKQKEG